MAEFRVLFVLPRMISGGVERVTVNLMAALIASGEECALALRRSHGELLGEARALVEVTELAADGMQSFVPRLAARIREWKPTHVVTAFADVGLLTLAALRLAGSDAPLIHGVHDSHGPEVAKSGLAGRVRHAATNVMAGGVYRHAAAIITVSNGARQELLARFNVDPDRVRTIYNPVVEARHLEPRAVETRNVVRMVAVGRLARQKGFDILVAAAAALRRDRPWSLDIYGEGPERPKLESGITRFGLADRVALRGYTSSPMECMRAADLFVLSSRHEGLPTVLIEALACQAQIVATDCRHGPREILEEGQLGQLVPVEDPIALAEALERAMDGAFWVEPRLLRQRAQDFAVDASLSAWRRVLAETRR